MLEASPEISPPIDIFWIDIAILKCLSGPLHLVDPKLVHLPE